MFSATHNQKRMLCPDQTKELWTLTLSNNQDKGGYSLSSFSSTGERAFSRLGSGSGKLSGLFALAFTAFGGGGGAIFFVFPLSPLPSRPVGTAKIDAQKIGHYFYNRWN